MPFLWMEERGPDPAWCTLVDAVRTFFRESPRILIWRQRSGKQNGRSGSLVLPEHPRKVVP
jgi:hypothetical protein